MPYKLFSDISHPRQVNQNAPWDALVRLSYKWDGTQNYQSIIKTMYYLRKDKAGHNIYNCPNCSAEIRASGEMIKYIVSQIMSDRAKALCNKLTPEERKAKAIKAINTRWDRVRANGTVPPTE